MSVTSVNHFREEGTEPQGGEGCSCLKLRSFSLSPPTHKACISLHAVNSSAVAGEGELYLHLVIVECIRGAGLCPEEFTV